MSEDIYTDGRSGLIGVSMMHFNTGTLLSVCTDTHKGHSTQFQIHRLSVEQLSMLRDTIDKHISEVVKDNEGGE
jgi:hypothetical protein